MKLKLLLRPSERNQRQHLGVEEQEVEDKINKMNRLELRVTRQLP